MDKKGDDTLLICIIYQIGKKWFLNSSILMYQHYAHTYDASVKTAAENAGVEQKSHPFNEHIETYNQCPPC